MSDPLQTTLASDYIALSITIPANGAPVTLLSLLQAAIAANALTLALITSLGGALGSRPWMSGVKIIAPSAAFLHRRVSGGAAVTVAASADWLEPIGNGIGNALVEAAAGGAFSVTAIVYLR